MSVILRREKSTPLTFEDMDSNFTFLKESVDDIQAGIGSGALISDEYVRNLFAGGTGISYDTSSGTITLNPNSSVISINGKSGNVVLSKLDITYTTDDIAEGVVNSYYTDQRVNDTIKNLLKVSGGLNKVESSDSITFSPRNFNIRLTGAVTGSATVNELNDVVISTNPGPGLAVTGASGETEIGSGIGFLARSPGQLDETQFDGVEFDSSDFIVQATDTYVRVSSRNTDSDIISTIGGSISGTVFQENLSVPLESGIFVTYDSENSSIRVAPRDFEISIIGAVSGSATVSRLRDTVISVENTSGFIEGINVQQGTVPQNVDPITTINFNSDDFEVSAINEIATISLKDTLTAQEVRDIIGDTVVGTERISSTGSTSETGIIVNYDADNNVLEVAPRDFTIDLIGDVSGTATVSKLRDISINTTTSAIKGLAIASDSAPVLALAKGLNFSSNFSLSSDPDTEQVTIDIENVVDDSTIRNALFSAFTGAQDGISIGYNESEEQFSATLNDLSVNLVGAVTGTGTIQYSGNNTQVLSVVTEIGEVGSGLEVRDEGEAKGDSIAAINFVGAGVTSSVTVDGQVATVNIPNSPAAEKFILLDNGSANVPNARRLRAGTGIIINDGGGGGDVIVSASGGDVLGKIQVEDDGVFVAEEPIINLVSSQQVYMTAAFNESTSAIDIVAYSKLDGWYRNGDMDHGEITDKYGNSLDMGNISVGIIEHQIDFGEIA